MSSEDTKDEPKKKLESSRGGIPRKPKTAIGSGDAGRFDMSLSDESSQNPQRNSLAVVFEPDSLIRSGLNMTLEESFEVVTPASDQNHFLQLVSRLTPALVLIEPFPKTQDNSKDIGPRLVAWVRKHAPRSRILISTDLYRALRFHNRLLRAGADGFSLKSSSSETLIQAINHSDSRNHYCDPRLQTLAHQATDRSPFQLSLLEMGVLLRLDLSTKEIVDELEVEEKTYELLLTQVLSKLGAKKISEAKLAAADAGIILLPSDPKVDPVTGIEVEQILARTLAKEARSRRGK